MFWRRSNIVWKEMENEHLKLYHWWALRYMEPIKTLSKTCRFTDTADFTWAPFIRIRLGWNCILNWIRNNLVSVVYTNSQIRRFQKHRTHSGEWFKKVLYRWAVSLVLSGGRLIRVKNAVFRNILIRVIGALLKTETPYFLQSLYVRWPKLMQRDKDFSSASSRLNASQIDALVAMEVS